MSPLEQTAVTWLTWMWTLSWQLALFVGLVTLACWLLRSSSPRLRHALWLLVLIKILIPPSMTAPWSIGQWVMPESIDRVSFLVGLNAGPDQVDISAAPLGKAETSTEVPPALDSPAAGLMTLPVILMLVWGSLGLTYWGVVTWRYRRLSQAVDHMPTIDEGPLRIGLEQHGQRLGVRRLPELHIAETITSPFLIGISRPRIVLPQTLIARLTSDDIQTVLTHELLHWRRLDTWIGYGQVIVQGLFWFHPFVWWATAQLRIEREHVCDDAVLRLGLVTAEEYGEVIMRVLTTARGRSDVAGSVIGVFERGGKLQQRLENVMRHETKRQEFNWWSRAFVGVFALLFLPIGTGTETELEAEPTASVPVVVTEAILSQATDAADTDVPPERKTPDPQIVRLVPKPGATGVSVDTKEISVTFDRDMSKGMSWTGGGKEFPPIDKSRKARWIDDRTCVLPVKLKKGQYYRLGINSKSYQNFKSATGVPAAPVVLSFTTEGAPPAIERRVKTPTIVELDPPNQAAGVDPATSTLRVTFDMPMGEAFSWTGGGEHFPEIPNGQRPRWSKDRKTCTLPVKLMPGHTYRLGLNSKSHNNFQSHWGVPLEPVVYTFETAAE